MKKKITFIINNFLVGGTEKLLIDLINHLDKEKFEIHVITILGKGPWISQLKATKVYLAGPKKYPGSDLVKFFLSPWIFFRLSVLLAKIKPDIVVTSLYQSDILGIFSAYLLRIKKRIVIQHDLYRLNFFFKFFKKVFALNLATRIVANSKTSKEFLITFFGVKKEKIVVIHNGIDVLKISQAIKKQYDQQEIVLGVVGRLEPVKGHIFLLQALKSLKESHNLFPKTLFIGNGSLRRQLEEFIKENDLNNIQIIWTALDVVEKLKLVDILVMPSLSEGFGLAALEGLFSHKIVVASDLPAIRELMADKKNGLLFKPNNSQELANILYQLLSDPAFCQDIKRGTEEWIKTEGGNFDIRNIASQYEKLF